MAKKQNIITPKPLELGTGHFDTMFTIPYVELVNCLVSCVMCDRSHVKCHQKKVNTKNGQRGRDSQWKV